MLTRREGREERSKKIKSAPGHYVYHIQYTVETGGSNLASNRYTPHEQAEGRIALSLPTLHYRPPPTPARTAYPHPPRPSKPHILDGEDAPDHTLHH